MKLINLKILDNFRSLQSGFQVKFHSREDKNSLTQFHPFCLAGLNGSGKSNILEALANIFYHLECCTTGYPEFAFSKKYSFPDAYELEYFIADEFDPENLDKLIHVFITKKIGKPPTMRINHDEAFEISKDKGKSCLPDLVVSYSSGENETLSLPFVKTKLFQYDEYIKDYINGSIYEKPKSSLLYVDYEMSQAVLLTILLFFDFEKNGEKDVLYPLKEELGVEGMHQFTINLRNNWQKVVNTNIDQVQLSTVSSDDEYESDENKSAYKGRILDHLNEFISKLEQCATSVYQTDDFKSLDFWINNTSKEYIRKKFSNDPYKFFSVFQMLQALNERVEDLNEKREIYASKGYFTDYKRPEYSWFFYFTDYFILKRDKTTDELKSQLLKQFSDGEQQFLHTLGICLMLQNKRTLLLLDEPETHFNPDWRSKFINILRKTLQAGGDKFLLKDIILTSHSPFIISDCLPDKVIQFKKTLNGITATNATELNFKTFGASVDYILRKLFGINSLVSDYSREYIKNIIQNGTIDDIREAIDFVGESDLKQFLFRELYKRTGDDNN